MSPTSCCTSVQVETQPPMARPDRRPASDAARRTAGYFKIIQTTRHAAAATPPPRRPNSSTPPPRRQTSSAAHPSTKTQVPQSKIDENGGLMEYSVVYTDRAMNHMSAPFQEVMHCVEIKFRAPHVVDET